MFHGRFFYLPTISSFIFSGQEILLKGILIIVMATGHWIEINVVGDMKFVGGVKR